MKKCVLVVLMGLCLVVSACSKKGAVQEEDINPEEVSTASQEDMSIDSEEFTNEPVIRGNKAENIAELSIIFFDFDSSSITGTELSTVKSNATYLKNNPNVNVVVEGYCDERGTTEYNLALGQRRALKVKEYYVQMGISPARIATVSYGEEMPLDKRSNEAGWARNRRAETKILVNK